MKVAAIGLSFALGALTALGLTWNNAEPPLAPVARRAAESPPAALPGTSATPAPAEAGPTASGAEALAEAGTAGPARDEFIAPADRDLVMPVDGVDRKTLFDTFSQTRGGTRVHEALDIVAPRGTPVRAVRDGHIEKLFTSDQGGLTVYLFEPSGVYAYYYAHLDAYAPGLAEGRQVKKGDLLGYVGTTGNAAEDAPHLHFAIFRLGPERRWWEGEALNPYPLLK